MATTTADKLGVSGGGGGSFDTSGRPTSTELGGEQRLACSPVVLTLAELNSWLRRKWEWRWNLFRPTNPINDDCSPVNNHHHNEEQQYRRRFRTHQLRLHSLALHVTVVLFVVPLLAYVPTSVGSMESSGSAENETLSCMKGVTPVFPGVTIPRGDILLKEGDTLEVFCKLNLTHDSVQGYNASNIYFKFTNANISPDRIVPTVINESTAVVRVKDMNASKPYLQCMLRKGDRDEIIVCPNQIEVGFPPLPVENFRCISMEWKSLTCTWNLPPNPIKTEYTLTTFYNRWFRPQSCPNTTATATSCTWGPRTDPHYRQNTDPLNFLLNGTNPLVPSGLTWNYSFSLWSIVIPETPQLNVIQKSPISYTLNWTFPYSEYFKPGLEHELSICCEYEEDCQITTYHTKPKDSKDGRMTPYLMKDIVLPHANANYTISVRMRSPLANKTEEFWSQANVTWIRTDPKAPEYPPEVNVGSFESVIRAHQIRDIYIYWKSIPEMFRNGSNFAYDISVIVDDREHKINPQTVSSSYALFSNLSTEHSYHFSIQSTNSLGRSPNVSEIIVPRVDLKPEEPKSVSKIDFTNGSYEISWRRPDRYLGIQSYTVFRCICKKPRPYPCEGLIEWEEVQATYSDTINLFYNLSGQHEHVYQFAVSANSDVSASGMVWATCNLINNKIPGKLKKVSVTDDEQKDDEIRIQWDLECSYHPGDIDGFMINYCEVEKHNLERCKDDERSFAVEGANTTTYRLRQLKPYTMYKIYVSVIAREVRGQRSEPLYARTAEGAPTSPIISNVSEVTNNSAVVHIQSPLRWNGILREYKIYLAPGRQLKLRVALQTSNDTTDFTEKIILANLTSNSNYTVFVEACTRVDYCSFPSEGYTFTTDIGRTDLTTFPRMVMKDGHMHVEWNSPVRLGGSVDYFEVMVVLDGDEVTDSSNYPTVKYSKNAALYTKELEYQCAPGANFTAQVRAVTTLASGQHLYGSWSPPGNHTCGKGLSWIVWVMLVFVAFVAVVFIVSLSFWLYHYIRRIEDVPIKLPPGLNQELNGFTRPPPRGRSHEQSTNFSFPLQSASNHIDESRDFLSSSDQNHGEAEDSLMERPFNPSPTNPLLGGMDFTSNSDGHNCGEDEGDIRLTEFYNNDYNDRCPSPTYQKLGVLSNGTAVAIDVTPGPSSTPPSSNSIIDAAPAANHVISQISGHPSPLSLSLEPSTSNGINKTVPDVLSSSPSSPASLNSIPAPQSVNPPAPVPAPPAPTSSYVKWTTLVPEMKTGDVNGVLENRQSPYCQVALL